MKKLLFFFVALLSLVAATPAANAKRSIMELPPFERAVLIIKKFETLHREIQLMARFHNPKMDCDCRVEARI